MFNGTTHSVSLTTEGQHLVPAAICIVAELNSISDAINQISSRAQRTLTVGVTLIIACVMPAAITGFNRDHPQTNVHIMDINRQAIQELVSH